MIACNNLYSQTQDNGDLNLPKLNGHKFITNSFIPNPFIKSKIRSNLGFATSLETEIPLLRFGDTSNLKLNADITYASGFFEFDYAVKDWAAIWLKFSGIARLGTNTASIFVSGITANTAFETGMLFKIKEFRNSLFSSSIKIQNANSTELSIYKFIRSILDTNISINTSKLVNNFNPLSGNIDLRFAFAPSPKWSILSFIEGGIYL